MRGRYVLTCRTALERNVGYQNPDRSARPSLALMSSHLRGFTGYKSTLHLKESGNARRGGDVPTGHWLDHLDFDRSL